MKVIVIVYLFSNNGWKLTLSKALESTKEEGGTVLRSGYQNNALLVLSGLESDDKYTLPLRRSLLPH